VRRRFITSRVANNRDAFAGCAGSDPPPDEATTVRETDRKTSAMVRILASGELPCDLAPVRRAIHAALRPYGVPAGARVGLAFVDDFVMKELNVRHRGVPRTTDVLSFGQALPRSARGAAAARALAREADGEIEVGDIVISGAQAARQARRRRQALVREVAFLAAHGALHLLGFEDDTREGYREMVRLGTDALGR